MKILLDPRFGRRAALSRTLFAIAVAVILVGATFAYLLSSGYSVQRSSSPVTTTSSPSSSSSIGSTVTTTRNSPSSASTTTTRTRSLSTITESTAIEVVNSSASASNSTLGLRLGLELSSNSSGFLTIVADESNLRNATNDVPQEYAWPYSPDLLNPYSNCGISGPIVGPQLPFGIAVFRGYLGADNFTAGEALPLYDTTHLASCVQFGKTSTNATAPYYSFDPLSDRGAYVYPGAETHPFGALSFSTDGYWTGGQGTSNSASLERFPTGAYTVVAVDEWGQLLLLHFDAVASAGPVTS